MSPTSRDSTTRLPPALPVVRVTAAGRNEGKTLLAGRLIEELTKRGYTVAAVKRSHHSVPPDRAGSDTGRFAHAGASVVLFCGPDGSLARTSAPSALGQVVRRLTGEADIAVVEGFKGDSLGAAIRLSGGLDGSAVLATMAGETVLATAASDVEGLTAAIEREFQLSAAGGPELRALVRRASAAHGHCCPGIVLGVRMALTGLAALDLPLPLPPHRLHVTVEVARCATDAIASVTGCSAGQRSLVVEDRGEMAATFRDELTGRAVRVIALERAREPPAEWAPAGRDRHCRQAIAYRAMPDELLLQVVDVPVTGTAQPIATLSPAMSGVGTP